MAYSIGHEVVHSACTSLIPLQLSYANIYQSWVGSKYVNQHALIWYFVDKIHTVMNIEWNESWQELIKWHKYLKELYMTFFLLCLYIYMKMAQFIIKWMKF